MPIGPRLTVVFALFAAAASPAAQRDKPPDYGRILDLYRAGDSARAIEAAARVSDRQIKDELKALVAEGARLKQSGRPRVRLWTAAMLHLECSLAEEERGLPHRGERQLRIAWQFAGTLFPDERYEPPSRLQTERPGTDAAFVRQWFRFMVVHDIARRWHNIVQRDIDAGLKMTARDPEILLAEGALHEVVWRDKHEEGRDNLTTFPADLAEAERALQEAVDADPGLDEARVRLGRVQAMRGEPDVALRSFASLVSGAGEPGFVYLARLFAGDVHEAAGDWPAAERAYSDAIAVMPAAQSAQIARAHVRHTAGHRAEAIDDIVTLAQGASVTAEGDPWLIYRHGVVWRLPGYLDTLRALVRQ